MEVLERLGSKTSVELARELNVSVSYASKLLGRYHKQGLLKRKAVDSNTNRKRYSLDGKGEERLEFLKET